LIETQEIARIVFLLDLPQAIQVRTIVGAISA
jgi:hypothetical protein